MAKSVIHHPNCKTCKFWVYHDSCGGWHCQSGFRPLVRSDWSYDCREMAASNERSWIKQSGGFVQLSLF